MEKTFVRSVRLFPSDWEEAGKRARAAGMTLNAYVVDRIAGGRDPLTAELPLGPGGKALVLTGVEPVHTGLDVVAGGLAALCPSLLADAGAPSTFSGEETIAGLAYVRDASVPPGTVQLVRDGEVVGEIRGVVGPPMRSMTAEEIQERFPDVVRDLGAELRPIRIDRMLYEDDGPGEVDYAALVDTGPPPSDTFTPDMIFPCGHERSEENSRRAGKNRDGTVRLACKTCRTANDAKRDWKKVKA